MVVDARFLCVVIGASAVVVVVRPTWHVARYAVTAVHELGHLVAAVALGGRAARVRLRADTSGLTTWRTTQPGRGRSALVALSGPAFPPLVGAACALAFATNRALLGVVALTIGVAVIGVVVRNLWGWVVCIALAAICWLAWNDGAGAAQVLMVVSSTVLCVGGIRAIAEEMSSLPVGGVRDTQIAARALWLPPVMWGTGLLLWALAWTSWATWQVSHAL
jgi:hypothetical protein